MNEFGAIAALPPFDDTQSYSPRTLELYATQLLVEDRRESGFVANWLNEAQLRRRMRREVPISHEER